MIVKLKILLCFKSSGGSDLHSLRQRPRGLVALLAKTKNQELYAGKFPSEALG